MYARLKVNGKRPTISINQKVDDDLWNLKRQRAKVRVEHQRQSITTWMKFGRNLYFVIEI